MKIFQFLWISVGTCFSDLNLIFHYFELKKNLDTLNNKLIFID